MTMVRRTYDHRYFRSTIHRTFPNAQRNRQRIRLILRHHQQGRLLEIGPGTGEFLQLAARTFDVEGIEISADAVKAVQPGLRGAIRVGNIEHAPLPRHHYQIVTAFNVLEHLHNPQAAVAKVRQALATGGCFVGSMPHNAGTVGRLYTQISNFFDRTHCSTLPPEQWRAVFQQAGFTEIVFFGEIPFSPHFCLYVNGQRWSTIAANLMFVCH